MLNQFFAKNPLLKVILLGGLAGFTLALFIFYIKSLILIVLPGKWTYLLYRNQYPVMGLLFGLGFGILILSLRYSNLKEIQSAVKGNRRDLLILIGSGIAGLLLNLSTGYFSISVLSGAVIYYLLWKRERFPLTEFYKIDQKFKVQVREVNESKKGKEIQIEFPPYCLYSGEETTNTIDIYLEKYQSVFASFFDSSRIRKLKLTGAHLLPDYAKESKLFGRIFMIAYLMPLLYFIIDLFHDLIINSRTPDAWFLILIITILFSPIFRYGVKVLLIPVFPSIHAYPLHFYKKGNIGESLGLKVNYQPKQPKAGIVEFQFYRKELADTFEKLNESTEKDNLV